MLAYNVHLGRALCYLSLLLSAVFLVAADEDSKFTLRKLEKIKEDEKDFESRLDIIKGEGEGNVKLNGELKQHVTLDNDWKVNITMYHTDNLDNEYKKSPKHLYMGVCQFMGGFYKSFLYEKLKDYSNAPHPDTCPLPPENYHLKDYPFSSTNLKKLLQKGFYRVFGRLEKNDEVKIEYLMEFEMQ